MRVLVADDTIVMRMLLTDWIEGMGFSVALARDGGEALALAESEAFDIAVVDWEMPKLNGMEVIHRLRASPRTAYSHLIVITANEEPERLIQALEGGADDFVRKPLNPAALVARLRVGARMVGMRQEILRLASTDPLTGAANRRCFFERAAEHVSTAARRHRPLSVLATDLDHFKRINDTYGHAGGDEALKRFAEVMRAGLRPCDVLGRLGGEEFAVILPDTPLAGAVAVAERLRAAVADAEMVSNDRRFSITVSIGAAEWTHGAPSLEKTLALADDALYAAKAGGRNRVERAA